MHIQGSKFGGKIYKFCGKSFKIELHGVHGVRFFQVCIEKEPSLKQGQKTYIEKKNTFFQEILGDRSQLESLVASLWPESFLHWESKCRAQGINHLVGLIYFH